MSDKQRESGFGQCCFKRTKKDSWEYGVLLRSNKGDLIFSEQGEIFKPEQVFFKKNGIEQNIEKLETINLCTFQRISNGPWEKGVLLNNGRNGILDKNGMFVLDCWDWRAINGFYINVEGFLQPFLIE